MKFRIPDSDRTVSVNIANYRIDWDGPTRSKMQSAVKAFLHPFLKNHLVCEEVRVPRTRLTIDIIDFTTKIAYEIQGKQHKEFVRFYQGNITGFLRQLGRDGYKMGFLEYNGYELVQIEPQDMKELSREFFLKKFNVVL